MILMNRKARAVALCVVCFSQVVGADEGADDLGIRLDETALLFQEIPSVYAASKYEQKITQAPASISIVTADEIRKYGHRTLEDILESLRGFVISNDRNYQYSSVRGFGPPGDYNNRILVLLDGRRVNDAIYDSVGLGHDFLIDVELIDRIEVIRGPSSSLYGANAFFAVINVITKNGRDLQGLELAAAYGSNDTVEARASYGYRFANGLEVLLSGTHFQSDGDDLFFPEFDDAATNNGVAEDADDEEADSVFVKLAYRDWTFEAAYNDREKGVPTASYGTVFNDPRTKTIDGQWQLNLRYESPISTRWDMRADIFYAGYDYTAGYVYDYSDDDEPFLVVNNDFAYGRWWGGELQLGFAPSGRQRWVFGAEVQRNERLDQGNFDLEVYLDDQQDSSEYGLYTQGEFKVLKKLIINAGLRYDKGEKFDDVSPRTALIYNVNPKSTIKLLYGTAFREGNAYELFYSDDFQTQKPPLELDPETIETTELLLEHSFSPRLRGVASIFHYEVDNLITLITDPTDGLLVFTNTDTVVADGIELELEGKTDGGWSGRVGYSYQEVENDETGERSPNSPKQLIKLNLIAPVVPERIFAGMELQYTDERQNVRGIAVDSYWVANLTLHAPRVWETFDISASVYNVFDEDYADPGSEEHIQEGIRQDGRAYRLKLRYEF
jgi:iron complex outermembrane receptor protein